MKDIKASVIIPAYNAERFICRAINSALTQTENNIEVIVVNDGSTDGTEEKCLSYQNNKRVRYARQENRGPAAARNHGLRMAEGEYVAFLDADDCLAPEMIERMVAEAERENADIVVCDIEIIECDGRIRYYTDYQEGGVYRDTEIAEKIVPNFLAVIDETGKIRHHDWAVLRRIFKRGCLNEHGIVFHEGLKNSEDCLFTYTATVYASCISYLKNSYYYRNIRNGISLSYQCVPEYWNQRLLLISEIQKINDFRKITVLPETWAMFVFMCALAGYNNIARGVGTRNILFCYQKLKEITDNEHVVVCCKRMNSDNLNDYFRKLYFMCSKRKIINLLLYYFDLTKGYTICHSMRRIGKKLGLLY